MKNHTILMMSLMFLHSIKFMMPTSMYNSKPMYFKSSQAATMTRIILWTILRASKTNQSLETLQMICFLLAVTGKHSKMLIKKKLEKSLFLILLMIQLQNVVSTKLNLNQSLESSWIPLKLLPSLPMRWCHHSKLLPLILIPSSKRLAGQTWVKE